MDKNAITKLEDFIFNHKKNPDIAAHMMADYLGVMIGVKPAATNIFEAEEFIEIDPGECIEVFDRVGLKALFFREDYIDMGKSTWFESVYVSRDIETANKLRRAFEKLHDSIDGIGQTCNQKEWEESSIEIGHLLGYPDTAVEYFITERDVEDEQRQQIMSHYQFYIHSPKHHEQEYQAYDAKIYQAIRDFAPKTADIILLQKAKKDL